jgi:hypothetical protein
VGDPGLEVVGRAIIAIFVPSPAAFTGIDRSKRHDNLPVACRLRGFQGLTARISACVTFGLWSTNRRRTMVRAMAAIAEPRSLSVTTTRPSEEHGR